MRKGLHHSLEAPAHRRVNLDGSRPTFCIFTTTLVLLLIFCIFGVSAWSIYSHQFSQNQYHFHAGDQVALTTVADDLMYVFCDGYKVTLMDQDKAYLLPHRAHVNQSLMTTSSFSFRRVQDGHYSFLEVYLLQGSSLHVGACRENGSLPQRIRILIIEGWHNFNHWKLDPHCTQCLYHHVTILPTSTCPEPKPEEDYFNVTFTSTDRFFLITHYEETGNNDGHHLKDAGVIVKGTFHRARYSTTKSELECKGIKTCQFDIPWGSSEDIIINFDDKGGKIGVGDQSRTFTTKCAVRYGFWIPIFFGIPFFIAIPITATFSWFLCRKSREPSLKKLSKDNKAQRSNARKEVKVKDDSVLVKNEVVQEEDDGTMTIQDG